MYDKIEEEENLLVEARAKKQAIEAEKLTADNIYKVLIYFEKLYGVMNDVERRRFIEALISEIQIFPERQPNGQWLKSIKFKLPIIGENMELSLDNDKHVDAVNALAEKFKAADGLVLASPVYFASANATLVACLDRLFYSTSFDKTMKVGASVVCGRRGGCSATFDELNKYFTISGMPIASGQYWNSIHGRAAGEAELDEEGRQSMRTLARNMTFLMKSIALGKEKFGLPEKEEPIATNFIR